MTSTHQCLIGSGIVIVIVIVIVMGAGNSGREGQAGDQKRSEVAGNESATESHAI